MWSVPNFPSGDGFRLWCHFPNTSQVLRNACKRPVRFQRPARLRRERLGIVQREQPTIQRPVRLEREAPAPVRPEPAKKGILH